MTKHSEIIRAVIDLLDSPEKWIKERRAKDINGFSLNPPESQAVSWCLGGAVMQVTNDNTWHGWYEYGMSTLGGRLHALAKDRGYGGHPFPFVAFNNDSATTYEDIQMLLKEALYDAEADEASAAIADNLEGLEMTT